MNTSLPEPTTPAMSCQPQHDDDERCSYPGKKCLAVRARKPNGTLHKLCELHRRRANLNQKRLQQKRRLLRDKLFKRTSAVRDEIIAEPKLEKPSPTSSYSPSSSTSSKRTSSSPVSLDATATAGFAAQPIMTSLSYSAQLEYLFADPLLQVEALQQQHQQQQQTPVLTSDDMCMLQDVLFSDFYYYPSDLSDDALESQLSWFAQV